MYGFNLVLKLCNMSSLCQREIIIPSDITFKSLHEIISVVFNIDKESKFTFILEEIDLQIRDTGTLNRDTIDARYEIVADYLEAFSNIIYHNASWKILLDVKRIEYDEDYPKIISFIGDYNPTSYINSPDIFDYYLELLENENTSYSVDDLKVLKNFKELKLLKIQEKLMILFNLHYEITKGQIVKINKKSTLDEIL